MDNICQQLCHLLTGFSLNLRCRQISAEKTEQLQRMGQLVRNCLLNLFERYFGGQYFDINA